jgi:formylglycine-generating enzyme required for sulfatase activity
VSLANAGASRTLIGVLAPPAAADAGAVWLAPTDHRQMGWAPEGSFQMGSAAAEAGRKEDEAQNAVQIPRGFWLDVTEVSNDAYRRFVLANAAWQKDRIDRRLHDGNYLKDWNGTDYPAGKGDAPAVWVSWYAASAYAKWAGKRLPSEAEWEYAARAGTQTAYWWGDAFDGSHVAPLAAPADPSPFRSPWNVVGMIGGVWEWTSSVYRPYPYRAGDGREETLSSDRRVKRGGSASNAERFLRPANRSSELPEVTSDLLGFRCAR